MYSSRMFDPSVIDTHIPSEIKYRRNLYDLAEVEEYFIKKCKEIYLKISHDCSADERSFWKTLNYTTYSGMFMLHPLSREPSLWQMYDALVDNYEPVGHIEWIENRIKTRQQSKYTMEDGSEFGQTTLEPYTHVCVLPGHNKFNHVSKPKIHRMIEKHGKNLVFKLHPITGLDFLEKNGFINIAQQCQIADKHSDLYSLIENAEFVYTTHVSETALTSLIMGKKISPIDPYKTRMTGSYGHISHFCYTDDSPLETLGKIFASPKSGVIHPEVDKDWKGKIDQYLEYVLKKRNKQKLYYYE